MQAQREEAHCVTCRTCCTAIFTHDDSDVIDSLQALCDSRTPLKQIREAQLKLRSVIKTERSQARRQRRKSAT